MRPICRCAMNLPPSQLSLIACCKKVNRPEDECRCQIAKTLSPLPQSCSAVATSRPGCLELAKWLTAKQTPFRKPVFHKTRDLFQPKLLQNAPSTEAARLVVLSMFFPIR